MNRVLTGNGRAYVEDRATSVSVFPCVHSQFGNAFGVRMPLVQTTGGCARYRSLNPPANFLTRLGRARKAALILDEKPNSAPNLQSAIGQPIAER